MCMSQVEAGRYHHPTRAARAGDPGSLPVPYSSTHVDGILAYATLAVVPQPKRDAA